MQPVTDYVLQHIPQGVHLVFQLKIAVRQCAKHKMQNCNESAGIAKLSETFLLVLVQSGFGKRVRVGPDQGKYGCYGACRNGGSDAKGHAKATVRTSRKVHGTILAWGMYSIDNVRLGRKVRLILAAGQQAKLSHVERDS